MIRFTPDMLDQQGKLRVWSIPEGRWKSVWPVDARSMFEIGTARLQKDDEDSIPDMGPPSSRRTYDAMSAPELKQLADERGIPHAAYMRKPELIGALIAHDGDDARSSKQGGGNAKRRVEATSSQSKTGHGSSA